MNSFRIFAAALTLAVTTTLFAAPLSGTRSIGPTGDYLSISNAIVDIQAQTLGGALVLELQTNYVSTVETFPLVFSNLTTTAANTLTLRPQLGATNLLITSVDTNAATIDLNGAQFVTIDGRPGGVGSNAGSGGGSASQLIIANTSTNGRVLRFINEASSNTITYITLRSVTTIGGTVFFSTTTGANGNDNNLIEHCDIGDGASTPSVGIYSFGTSTTSAQNNSGNTIANCNIFNFFAANLSAGVLLFSGNTDWTIASNSFYQTVSREAVATTQVGIYISVLVGNNFTVTDNFIGGSAPNAGGAPWTTTGTTALCKFIGISLGLGTGTASSVQGNTISNMVWTTSRNNSISPGIWSGIFVLGGDVNIGTVTGNTIGSGTGTGSISVTTSGTGGTSFGVGSTSSGTVAIANNTIGSITVNGSDNTISASLTGISVTAGTISNNLVGSTATANSLNATTSSTSATAQQVTGILSSSSASASITGNTVANLNNNYASTATAGQIRGIVTSAGVNIITGNTVRNLTTTSQNANATTSQSVYGIIDTSTTAGQTVAQNTVHSLANTTASNAAVNVTGIYFAGPTSGANVIARNFVHSLAVATTNASSLVNGMMFAAGNFTGQNNLVRVGLDASGTSTAGASTVRGIVDSSTSGNHLFYHNSVYLGGTQTSGGANSFTLSSSGLGNVHDYRNNIFVNTRSRSGTASGANYVITYAGTGINPAGLVSDGNLYFASGVGGVLGRYASGDRTTLAALQAATGVDTNSLNADPLFLAPAGTAATVDLHLTTNSPASHAGVSLPGVTDDFDGGLRSPNTPTIGAVEYPSIPLTLTGPSGSASGGSGGGTPFQLSFTNVSGLSITVLTSTNLALPVNLWSNLGTAVESPPGSYRFIDLQSSNNPQRYYRLRSP